MFRQMLALRRKLRQIREGILPVMTLLGIYCRMYREGERSCEVLYILLENKSVTQKLAMASYAKGTYHLETLADASLIRYSQYLDVERRQRRK